ncbi:Argonaute-like protein [Ceratobasidium theobromae]|uniref:Argonaute-like protein n=1 Tax=Ceratobasidium theobromae TaxID=1582974 RepID=A0A5N5Q875_9AGAM|nr:Argonaute-like protein [Ceratobasidium theobromae]
MSQSHGRGRGGPSDGGGHGVSGFRGGGRGFRGGGRGGSFMAHYHGVEPPPYVPDPSPAIARPGPKIAPGVVTIGVPRPSAPGTAGQPLTITTNHFKVIIPEATFHHYDALDVGDNAKPIKWNHELIRNLQEFVAPTIFTPRAVYDGRKNMYANRRLPFPGRGDAWVFEVAMDPGHGGNRPPKIYNVALKHVAKINTTVLKKYQEGKLSLDNMVSVATKALNVVIRMEPVSRYPCNTRSFFTDGEVFRIGGGIELWRGYFQSIRAGMRSMLINVDISTGAMYVPGSMITVCLQILHRDSPNALVPGQGLTDRDRMKLQRFLANVRFVTTHKERNGQVSSKPKTSSGAAYPIEVCSIIPGQLMRRRIPPEQVSSVLEFSTKKPDKRLNSIVAGHQVLQYGQSEYINQFGMSVSQVPEKCLARVLPTPAINYGPQNKLKQIRPVNGSWNLRRRKLFEPAEITGWALVVYDACSVREREAQDIVTRLQTQANRLGIRGMYADPDISFQSAQALDVAKHLHAAGQQVFKRTRKLPSLIVVVLPENAADLYQAVKYFGDVSVSCMLALTRTGAHAIPITVWGSHSMPQGIQVEEGINAKLGGVNSVLDPSAQKFISDVAKPAIIMGAHTAHPAPGAHGRPSFASVVGSIDSNAVHYTAISKPQDSHVEIIGDLEDMVYEVLGRHAWWKSNHEKKAVKFPKRIVYYRAGVSEGQFPHVLERELPKIRAACKRHNISPTITIVVVGKRHHVRFFPTHGRADLSGNCPAGTVVDDVRPSLIFICKVMEVTLERRVPPTISMTRYCVIYDENSFTVDSIQSLTFALCHVHARATRSVSVPAPVYYADIVSGRARNHYDPSYDPDETESIASGAGTSTVQPYKDQFRQTHDRMRYKM